MFLYTDGLVEQGNKEDELLGEEIVLEELQACDSLGAMEVVDRINLIYEQHSIGVTAEDDITMMAVRFK